MCRTVGIEAITFASVRLSYSCRKICKFSSNKDVPHWLEMTHRRPRITYERKERVSRPALAQAPVGEPAEEACAKEACTGEASKTPPIANSIRNGRWLFRVSGRISVPSVSLSPEM